MTFAPGDIVECVDTSPSMEAGQTTLVLRALYTVSFVEPTANEFGDFGVDVAECPCPTPPAFADEYGGLLLWRSSRFRHVYRPDPRLIELLQRAPAPELEPA